ncbi:MAG: hypothetical protein JXX29_13080 [Deltaproteobacteria bacterium]|nr:hypothetical protein [Deltaproteobacteria bacterium]MBN2672611.1 hypothetical protein [Deltaproteobacteria bacterium]
MKFLFIYLILVLCFSAFGASCDKRTSDDASEETDSGTDSRDEPNNQGEADSDTGSSERDSGDARGDSDTTIPAQGDADSDADSDVDTESASIADCMEPCIKAIECEIYSDMTTCTSECVDDVTGAEAFCINACDERATCDAWLACADACFDVAGNGEYCVGYEMGSDEDVCCQTNDPCDWASDSWCDCGGTCTWDTADCRQ